MLRFLLKCLITLVLLISGIMANAVDYPAIIPGHVLAFPADHGAHPQYRTEWWYITGWLETETHQPLGFQITFFRSRPDIANTNDANPSRFAPRQLILAHAALSDPALQHVLHDQRSARAGFGIAEASSEDTSIHLDQWSLNRTNDNVFHANILARDFRYNLSFSPTQAMIAQGENAASPGFSQKGPTAAYSSEYYSIPHLAVHGSVERNGKTVQVTGTAWMDHEWSSSLLAPGAVGWDWIGINLEQGAALMAFRIRNASGGTVWAGGSLLNANGQLQRLKPDAIQFETVRTWPSPHGADASIPQTDERTNAHTDPGTSSRVDPRSYARTYPHTYPRTYPRTYPISQRVRIKTDSGDQQWLLEPLIDDQELDSRASTAAIYWEGAVSAKALTPGTPNGKGYLELTGYDRPLQF